MYAIRRGEFVELFKAEFPALKWLLADATRKPLENVKPQSFSTPDSREPAEDPLPQQELCHRARAIIANRAVLDICFHPVRSLIQYYLCSYPLARARSLRDIVP